MIMALLGLESLGVHLSICLSVYLGAGCHDTTYLTTYDVGSLQVVFYRPEYSYLDKIPILSDEETT